MKKFLVTILAGFVCVSNLSADITSHLENYAQLDCAFKERKATEKNERGNHTGTTKPHMPIEIGTSINWSGYASATNLNNPKKGTVRTVSGTWRVPQLLPTQDTSYTAIWVGIDGLSSNTVEQLGTEHDWYNGTQYDSAWFEMYPNPSYDIVGFPVNPGDVIQAEVDYIGHDQFRLSMVNHTQNIYTVIPGTYTHSSVAKRSSAEWIVEAPFSSSILPLSDFGEVSFTNCMTTIKGIKSGIANPAWQTEEIIMITDQRAAKAYPTPLGADDESFNVYWTHE